MILRNAGEEAFQTSPTLAVAPSTRRTLAEIVELAEVGIERLQKIVGIRRLEWHCSTAAVSSTSGVWHTGNGRTMRYFFRRRIPAFTRVLLIESGSRSLYENLLPGLYETHGDGTIVDLVTCFAGLPEGLRGSATIYRVTDYPGGDGRKRLLRRLAANRYSVLGMICSAEPIMTKWKWWLAARLPAKAFVLNENGDYLWLDIGHWRIIVHFILFRAGLTGEGSVRALARLLLFPFTLLYLLLYAAAVHLRRKVHS